MLGTLRRHAEDHRDRGVVFVTSVVVTNGQGEGAMPSSLRLPLGPSDFTSDTAQTVPGREALSGYPHGAFPQFLRGCPLPDPASA